MRELKFRAWDKKQKKMIAFDLASIYGYEGTYGIGGEVSGVILPDERTPLNFNSGYGMGGANEDLEIMQYTGLKDKNGVEIYEGDILSKDGRHYPVVYTCNEFSIQDYDNGDYYHGEDNAYHDWESFEVIGNIYENPELIKGEVA